MSAPELTLRDIVRRLRNDEPNAELPAELWARIVATHRQRLRRARLQRVAAGGAAAFALVVAGAIHLGGQHGAAPVDWQARAQALELQLHTLRGQEPTGGSAAQGELARLDLALQAAYDDGAEAARLEALWKRRSELLDVLLRARRENLEISRI